MSVGPSDPGSVIWSREKFLALATPMASRSLRSRQDRSPMQAARSDSTYLGWSEETQGHRGAYVLKEGWPLCGALEAENLETGRCILCRNQGCGVPSTLGEEKLGLWCGQLGPILSLLCSVSLNVSFAAKVGCSLQMRQMKLTAPPRGVQ